MGLWLRSQRPRRGQDKGNPESYQVGEVCEVLGAHPGFLDHWDPGIGTQEVEGIPPASGMGKLGQYHHFTEKL